MKIKTGNMGMLLLAIWLICTGLFPLLSISFAHEGQVMGVLAIVSGLFILVGR